MNGIDLKKYEIDRAGNVAKSFGWSMISSVINGDKVSIEFSKDTKGVGEAYRKFELERLANMVKQAGWSVTSSFDLTDQIKVGFDRVIKGMT